MKIVCLSNNGSGLVLFRGELLQRLAKEHETVVCVPDAGYSDEFQRIGCKFCQIDFDRRGKNPLKDLKLFFRYKKLLKEEKPDAVLTYTIKPNVYGGRAARALKIPVVANVTGLGTSIEDGGLLSRLTLSLYKNGLKKAHCVFFQNEKNMAFFREKGIVKGSARLIPGSGVNLEKHRFEEYPPKEENVRFLFVGRIMRDKGIGELLTAIKEVHERHPEVSLDIVGSFDGDYKNALDEAVKGGYIRYHGSQKDVHPFYADTFCTVLPSYHEGMANVLLESASTGRPVIASKVPGCKETFDEGVTGFGCEAKSADSLIEAMERFLSLSYEEKKKMGEAGRVKMEKQYDRRIVIDAYLDEIKKIHDSGNRKGT